MVMSLKLAGLAALFSLGAAKNSTSSPLTVLTDTDTGGFTFTLSKANYSANTDGYWTGTYYVPPTSQAAPVATYSAPALSSVIGSDSIVPLTVFVTNASIVTGEVLRKLVATYEKDDVFTKEFLQGVEILNTRPSRLDTSAVKYLESLSIRFLVLSQSMVKKCNASATSTSFKITVAAPANASSTSSASIIPPGPYVARLSVHGQLAVRKVYALFSDYQEAFHNGVIANDDGSYSVLPVWNAEQYAPLVPVPSRLYYSLLNRTQFPLAGLRFALKDLMPVSGLVTTGGSRAYARVYDTAANETAPAIARLLGLGAVLLGKAKLSTFAYGSYAYQNMDYSYSWNVRADGFLGLSASSFGPAAAIAAYDQLDFTVGSDTLGSVRNPADRVGVYGMRPSWGAINLTMVIPSAESMDTLGIFARSASMLQTVMGSWQTAEKSALQKGNYTLPRKIFYPIEWFPVNTTAAQTVIAEWLGNMTAAMGLELVHQNVTALFQKSLAPNDTLSNYTTDFTKLTKYDNWNFFGKAFVADYRKRFAGRWPEADNQVLTAWRAGQTMLNSTKKAIETKMATFGSFVNAHVLPYSASTCSEGIWVYQIEDTGGGVPEYREVLDYDYFPPFKPMRAASLAPFAKLVDITVPIGVVPYDSVISKIEEELVITLSFVAHHGCDTVLMEFLAACEKKGFCKSMKTGISAF